MTKLAGGCLCGAIRYEVGGNPLVGVVCHCRDCQYASGGGPSYNLIFEARHFALKHGSPAAYVSVADSGTPVSRLYCADCGTPLFAQNAKHETTHVSVRVGSLDDPKAFKAAGHIWTKSAPPWHPIDPNLPSAPGNPPGLEHAEAAGRPPAG